MESLKSSNGITFFSSPSVVYKQNAHNKSYNLYQGENHKNFEFAAGRHLNLTC